MPQPILPITSLRRECRDETWRVTATVGDHPLWFECDDTELTPCPEAFLATFFIPALHLGKQLTIDARVNPAWVDQTTRLLPIYHRWWGYPSVHPASDSSTTRPAPDRPGLPSQQPAPQQVAQCFTGGVDSFFSLLRESRDPEYLLYVHGYDIPIGDTQRAEAFQSSLRDVAQAMGITPILMRTNMRQHPIFGRVSWERTHGAALAAAGMLIAGHIDSLVIPSSYAYENATPWGSHWDTDPLWAAPDHLRIIHDDATLNRRDKILALAPEPLVQRHLRVCWRNLAPTGNCSRCEKCLRTMATLEVGGHLADYHRVFDVDTPLSKRLDAVSALPRHLMFVWKDLATRDVAPPTRAAIHRLLHRSERAAAWAPIIGYAKRGARLLPSALRWACHLLVRRLFGAPDKS